MHNDPLALVIEPLNGLRAYLGQLTPTAHDPRNATHLKNARRQVAEAVVNFEETSDIRRCAEAVRGEIDKLTTIYKSMRLGDVKTDRADVLRAVDELERALRASRPSDRATGLGLA